MHWAQTANLGFLTYHHVSLLLMLDESWKRINNCIFLKQQKPFNSSPSNLKMLSVSAHPSGSEIDSEDEWLACFQ